jgi:hypothetical protein
MLGPPMDLLRKLACLDDGNRQPLDMLGDALPRGALRRSYRPLRHLHRCRSQHSGARRPGSPDPQGLTLHEIIGDCDRYVNLRRTSVR